MRHVFRAIRPFLAALLSAGLVLLAPAAAEAHIVYFKDGTVVRGNAVVTESTVTVTGGGADMSFPLSTVRAISFNEEPIVQEQKRVEESRLLNSEPLLWSMVAANAIGVLVGVISLTR
ncbi:MAG: hypothetical protein VKP62_16535 [Candidatus Sericytochromatia bacterium]|nr:hypothetical protein [Candidatus Sericytochromatia bacterium]